MPYWKIKLGIIFAALLFAVPVVSAVEYEWKDGSGTTKSLADYKGKPVILHFWASWCPPCRSEMPEMQAWSKANKDVQIVIVSLDQDIEDAEAFLRSQGIDFPALRGDMAKAQGLGVRGLPTTLVIGGDSRIRKSHTGAVNWNNKIESEMILQAMMADS